MGKRQPGLKPVQELAVLKGHGFTGCGKSPKEKRIRQMMDWQGLKPDSFC
jgi:hypothetical protein